MNDGRKTEEIFQFFFTVARATHSTSLNESINGCTYSRYQLSICRSYLALALNFSCPFCMVFFMAVFFASSGAA